jgi:hypothetical protein
MLLVLHILVALSAVIGGTYGVERLFDRYATPEARSQTSLTTPEHSGEAEGKI